MPTRMRFKERRNQRREEAEARQEEREQRGDAGQLRRLESRGFGECAEAQRLHKKLMGGAPVVPDEAPTREPAQAG